MKYIFFGTEHWAARYLEYLISHDLKPIAVVTKEDKPVGRGLHLEASPVKTVALEHGISVLQPVKCSSPDFIEQIKTLTPDLCVLIAYGQILPKELLDIPPLGFINVHPSLLPKYRGPAPFQEPILNGDSETGISIMFMDEKMDHGPLLIQEHISLKKDETVHTLQEKVITHGSPLLAQTILALEEKTITPYEQDHTKATYTKLYKKDVWDLDFSKSTETIERMMRALNPWPGTWATWNTKRIKLLKSHIQVSSPLENHAPGTFFSEQDTLFVQCEDKPLAVDQLQLEGKKPLTGKEFIHGYLKKSS